MPQHHVAPEEAVQKYLNSRHDVTQSTRDNHRYRLGIFSDWAQDREIESMSSLGGLDVQEYANYRHNGADTGAPDCAPVTTQQHLHTLRVFLRFCERTDIIEEGLSDSVPIPSVSANERSRDQAIEHDRMTQILEYLAQFRWASKEHIILGTLYHTGVRRSALHALDVRDWHAEECYLSIINREDEGTRIKLGSEGERHVSITSNTLAEALNDWVETNRPQVRDEHGRRPLIATTHGRIHPQTISKVCYKLTRPCVTTDGCPHDRVLDECEAAMAHGASECPSSEGSHALRRSSITHHLAQDVPHQVVSSRMSVSESVLTEHYDARDAEQKRANREQYLDDV